MTITKPGDVWSIGNHKLACGDAGDLLTVASLMQGTRADLIFTSPPYSKQRSYLSEQENWDSLMQRVFSAMPAHDHTQLMINLGMVHQKCQVQWYFRDWIEWMKANGWREFALLVWDKGSSIPVNDGRLGHCFELIFHLNKHTRHPNKTKPKQAKSILVNNRTSSLRKQDGTMSGYPNPQASLQTHKKPDNIIRVTPNKHNRANQYGIHPATFPIKLPQEIIEAFTNPHDIVFDPFAGSGTTIIAAHQLNRIGYGIEIEPPYCDLAIDRLQRELKLKAYRHDGESFEHLSSPHLFESELTCHTDTNNSNTTVS